VNKIRFRRAPLLPQPGEGEQIPVPPADVHRLLPVSYARPLEETVRRDEAAAARQGVPEGRLLGEGLRPRIDELVSDPWLFGPRGDQSPPVGVESSRAVGGDDGDRLRRGDVVARGE